MAKQNFRDVQQQARQIMTTLRGGVYAPLYLLMGEEGFYTDKISNYIATHALGEGERDFNQTVVYGKDSDGGVPGGERRGTDDNRFISAGSENFPACCLL